MGNSRTTAIKPVGKREPDPLHAESLIRGEEQQQQMIMQQQDEQLDQVYSTVINMKNIAQTINTELDDQQQYVKHSFTV